jgi:hypothetical protein
LFGGWVALAPGDTSRFRKSCRSAGRQDLSVR